MLAAFASLLLGQADSARMSQLKLLRPTTWYVDSRPDAGSDTRDCRTPSRPCRTIQRACDQIPDDVCDAAAIYVDGGTYTAGCRREGLRRCSHRGADGGVVLGSLEISGQPTVYATGTISAVTNGSMATCQRETWTLSGNYALNEISLMWISAGSSDRKWPVMSNTAGPGSVATLVAQGEITSHPAIGATYTVFTAPATTISGNHGQATTAAGPEGTGQASGAAAFAFSSVGGSENGAASDRWITVRNFTVTGSATLVRENGGSVSVLENANQSTGSLHRGLKGRVAPSVERNILRAGVAFIGRNTTFGVDLGMAQIYNNLCGSGVVNGILSSSAAAVWAQSNVCPKALIRMGACDNCRSVGDSWGSIRMTGELDPGTSPVLGGSPTFSGDGLSLSDSAQTYLVSGAGVGRVHIDQIGGTCASTMTDANHFAAVADGFEVKIASGTTFAGAGDHAVVPTNTTGSITPATLRAMTPKSVTFWDGSKFSESGSSGAYSWLLSLANTTTLDGIQCDSGTATAGGVLAVTFSPAFRTAPRSCTCTDVNATPVTCGISTAQTTAGVTFTIGAARADVVNWCCVGGR